MDPRSVQNEICPANNLKWQICVWSLFLHQEVLVLFVSYKKCTNFIRKYDYFIHIPENMIASHNLSHNLSPFWCWEPQVDAALDGPPVRPQQTAEILSRMRFPASPPLKSDQIICGKVCLIQDSINDRTSEWVDICVRK